MTSSPNDSRLREFSPLSRPPTFVLKDQSSPGYAHRIEGQMDSVSLSPSWLGHSQAEFCIESADIEHQR